MANENGGQSKNDPFASMREAVGRLKDAGSNRGRQMYLAAPCRQKRATDSGKFALVRILRIAERTSENREEIRSAIEYLETDEWSTFFNSELKKMIDLGGRISRIMSSPEELTLCRESVIRYQEYYIEDARVAYLQEREVLMAICEALDAYIRSLS